MRCMSRHLTPIEVCEHLIAPMAELGPIVGLGPKAGYVWRRGSQWRDPGDMPPRVNRALLAHAAAKGIPLKPEHLIWGAPASEIEALQAGMRPAEPGPMLGLMAAQ